VVIAIESLLFLLAGIVLAVVLTRVFGKPAAAEAGPAAGANVKLVRSPRSAEGREETRLLLNGQVILIASNDGVRMADYAEEVEQLEAVAARLAGALGVTVEFERVPSRTFSPEAGLPVRDLPHIAPDEVEERRRRLDRQLGI
jgi:hypothetical protein